MPDCIDSLSTWVGMGNRVESLGQGFFVAENAAAKVTAMPVLTLLASMWVE